MPKIISYDALLSRGWNSSTVAVVSWVVAATAAVLAVIIVRTNRADLWNIPILALVIFWIASASSPQKA